MSIKKIAAIALSFLFMLPLPSQAFAKTTESENPLSLAGQAGGQTSCFAESAGYLYIGVGRNIKVAQFTNGAFREIASIGLLPAQVTALGASGGKLYAACAEGISCYDISSPTAIRKLFAVEMKGAPRAIKAFGSVVAVADGIAGIRLLNGDGKTISTVFADQDCLDIDGSGNTLYVAAGSAGLVAADVSDPTAPVILPSVDTPGFAWGVALDGNTAYIADGSEGVRAINIADRNSPKTIASAVTAGMALDVAAAGSAVYVADGYRGLRKLSVGSGGKLTDGGSFEYENANTAGVLLRGDTLYARDSGAGVIRLNANASKLAMTGYYGCALPIPTDLPAFIHHGYEEYGGYVELSALYTLGYIGKWPDNGSIDAGMKKKDFVAFYAKLGVALPKPDAKSANLPVTWTDALKQTVALTGLSVSGSPAEAGKKLGLTLNLNTAKKNPSYKDVYRMAGRALLINTPATSKSPAARKAFSSAKFSCFETVFDVKFKGNYIYEACDRGFAVLDAADPANPVLKSFYPTDGSCDYICFNGDYAYVTNGELTVIVFDISRPDIPILVGYYQKVAEQSSYGSYRDIACRDNELYLPDENGLEIVNCTDPYRLKMTSYLRFSQRTSTGIAFSGKYAYVCIEFNGIAGVDISDILHPKQFDTGVNNGDIGMTGFVLANGDKLYAPSSNGKLNVYGIQPDGTLRFLSDTGSGMDCTITNLDRDTFCTLGNYVTAFRLGSDGMPQQTGRLTGIESYIERGDLKNGCLAVSCKNGIYLISCNADKAGESVKTISAAPAQKITLSASMPEASVQASKTYGSTLKTSQFTQAKRYAVTSTADSGEGTLRDCLTKCRGEGYFVVTFDPKVFPAKSPAEIQLKTSLSEVDRTWIDASNAGVVLNCTDFSQNVRDVPIRLGQNCILMGMAFKNYPHMPLNAKTNCIIGGSRNIGAGPMGQGNAFYSYVDTGDLVISDMRADDRCTVKGNLFGVDVRNPEKRESLTLLRGITIQTTCLLGGTAPGEDNIFDRVETAMYLCGKNIVGNKIIGNKIGYTMDGKESECIFEALVLDMACGNIVCDNKVSISDTGRSTIVCTGFTGGNYNVICNNEATDHQVTTSQLGAYFYGRYNVVTGNTFNGKVSLAGNNTIFSGNRVNYIGQLGSLLNDDGYQYGDFIGGMGPGSANIIGEGNPPDVAFSSNSPAGPYIRNNTVYCGGCIYNMSGSASKVVITGNAIHAPQSVWDGFITRLSDFGAAFGNELKLPGS